MSLTPNDGSYAPKVVPTPDIFDPTDFANLIMWMRADSYASQDVSGLSSWLDKHSSNYDASQVTAASRPDLNTSDVNLNNRASITFGASQSFAMELTATSTEWTWFAVIYNNTNTGTRAIVDDSSTGFRFRAVGANLTIYDGTNSLSVGLGLGAAVVCCRFSASGVVRIDEGGTSTESTGTMAAVAITTPQMGSRFSSATSDNWEDEIAEIIAYDAALSDVDIDTMMDYLGARYGIANS